MSAAGEWRSALRGRPIRLGAAVTPELAAAVEVWRLRQADKPSRPEAVRRLLELGLDAAAKAKPGQ